MSDDPSLAGALPADLLRALVEQSLELLAVTDSAGTIAWANGRFVAAVGLPDGGRTNLMRCTPDGAAGESSRQRLAAALAAGRLDPT
ncbi:MAG: hypothetical protein ACXWCN_15380, partial [Caldimonas sp.]